MTTGNGTRPLRASPMAQAVLAGALSHTRPVRVLCRHARRWMVRRADPLVGIDIARSRLLAPLSHELPFYRQSFEHYDTALPRLARHLQQSDGGSFAVIDVGANIGDSAAALLAVPQTTVLAIEGDERFFHLLTANARQWAGRLTPVQSLLGERAEALEATIDAGRGTARLQPGKRRVVIRTLADVVDQYPAFAGARLVKIDTDGFDIAVLRGARDWLVAAQPALFFEYDPHFWRPVTPDGARIFAELADCGYGPLLAYDNFGWLAWSGTVEDGRRLEELDAWLSQRSGHVYVDLCVFPARAASLFEQFRCAELRHFSDARIRGA